MFGLLHGLYCHMFAKTELNIIIIGLDHAGKTTLLEQMKGIFKKTPGIPPEKIPPTIGLNIGKMDVCNAQCRFWDLGGQARMRSIWDKYYSDAHAMIFVLDSADAARFKEAKETFEEVRANEELMGLPVLVIANKQDLPGAMRLEDISRELLSTGAAPSNLRIQPASCLTCEGVEDGVRWVVEEATSMVRSSDQLE
mmetsp:Transcript_20902/g.47146  ORF Transcript_20902/g.47146 Transcript_20902/m.47146 type:complete len:196 (-) Transcript_20902:177-764(-)